MGKGQSKLPVTDLRERIRRQRNLPVSALVSAALREDQRCVGLARELDEAPEEPVFESVD